MQTFYLPLPNRLAVKILNYIQKKDDFHRKLVCVCVLLRLAGECFANIETSPLLVKFLIIWGEGLLAFESRGNFIVPGCCDMQPRILRTHPKDRPHYDKHYRNTELCPHGSDKQHIASGSVEINLIFK